jgi:hypothetical protein
MVRGSCRTILLLTGLLLPALWCTLAAGAASARQGEVVFLTSPASAAQGSTVRATVVVSRAVPRCTGTLRHAGTSSAKVVAVVRLRASFAWRLPATAAPGTWTIAVKCGRAGSAFGSFKVTRRTTPPAAVMVAVEKSGFSVAGTELGYGVVLRDTSATRDAVGVTVTVNVVDAANRVLRTDTSHLSGIPAGSTYYFGGDVFLDAGSAPASLQVSVRTEGDQPKRLAGPQVAGLTATADAAGRVHLHGELTNTATQPMSSLTRISGVVFDTAGNVIGGGVTFPTAPVRPNDHFDFDLPVTGVTADRIGSFQVSVV